MTRTARAPRLMNHRSEPFIEVHPEDARELGLADQALARLEGEGGDYRGRVRISPAQRRGELFVPIHWSDRFSASALAGALLASHVDPMSGQPESKHGAVALAALPSAWEATLVVAEDLDVDARVCRKTGYWREFPWPMPNAGNWPATLTPPGATGLTGWPRPCR
ncbi:nitrate reductase [Halomonas elongata]|uniref:Nitrate reductase n=1 Tax=Halomonas elongata TaxID=2746 RepID=A0A1B8NV48_HALEL|nr:nitrate reductase [Halomonas elongata]